MTPRREAAARRRAHAVRLAHHRPGCANKPGGARARAEACGEDRQDAGARRRRLAQAARQHADRHRARLAGKPGFDLRVLEEGEVEAGDEILRVASGPERMSVFEINALLYMPGHPRSQLERAPIWH